MIEKLFLNEVHLKGASSSTAAAAPLPLPWGRLGLDRGEREKLIEKLTAEMKAAARQLEFEKAAYLRDEIKKLREG